MIATTIIVNSTRMHNTDTTMAASNPGFNDCVVEDVGSVGFSKRAELAPLNPEVLYVPSLMPP